MAPIGPYDDFQSLKAHLRSKYKKLPAKRMNAVTAAVAEKIRPGWHDEAAKKAARTRKQEGE